MGISDLVAWVKKVHPSVIKTFPRRWADPAIKGKKVAIDATLLTNRFHFAQGEVVPDKQALIRWYHLVNLMRAHDVQPITIWDQRGVRDWKALEARKRLGARALNLARRTHEDARQKRLVELRKAVTVLATLGSGQREELAPYLENMRAEAGDIQKHRLDVSQMSDASDLKVSQSQDQLSAALSSLTTRSPDPSDVGPSNAVGAVDGASKPAPGAALETFITIAGLFGQYRDSVFRPRTLASPEEVVQALDHVRDLENLHLIVGQPSEPVDITSSPLDDDASVQVLDEKLGEVIPAQLMKESPRQAELTRQEGDIYSTLLAVPENGDMQEIFREVDNLIKTVPEIRATYERALNMPTQRHLDECKELLLIMGVPVIEAMIPYEGEGLAASLARAGKVDFVGTEDSDVLAYGGPLLKNLSSSVEPLVLIDGHEVQQASDLPQSAFLDFCVLLGTDASPRIPKVGPATALKLITKYGSIENMLDNEPKLKDRIKDLDVFMDQVKNARRLFSDLPPIPSDMDLKPGYCDMKMVDRFLEEEHGVIMTEVDSDFTTDSGSERFSEIEGIGERPVDENPPRIIEWDDRWGKPPINWDVEVDDSSPRTPA